MDETNEVTKLIRESGNNFHAKVARWFSNNDWHVIVSPDAAKLSMMSLILCAI